MNMLAA